MAAKKDAPLVVVESPTKAKTLRGFLPSAYRIAASNGHIRDLPESAAEIPAEERSKEWARLGVNVQEGFQPLYVVPASKRNIVKELKGLLKDASELIVATDEDREGESIGWHLLQVLNPRVPVSRIVFHEITEEAILEALKKRRQVDENLVRAQETRRILDRLVGYTVSPLLWKKIATGLSAGRVQSVAVRLLVQRERERRAFRSGTYWDLKALLRPVNGQTAEDRTDFTAQLVSVAGTRIATGRDFDEKTGRLVEGREVRLLDETTARELQERLRTAAWTVAETDEKPTVRRPAAPFTTSTLQQEANRKLKMSARDTMRVAQRLYEEGFITYMRTDSVHLSQQAINAARDRIRRSYGEAFLSPGPRQFTTQSRGAQEAHEAIRPAGTEMKTVDELELRGQERALYEMIWKRTVASQMADARVTQISAQIRVEDAVFRASGKRIDFPGFFRAYVEGSDDPDAALEDRDEPLPPLRKGDPLRATSLDAIAHETQPPARFTEASLVKTLESEGIGRPSTYAAIIGTVIDRGYVDRQGNQLVPTFTAFAVTGLLEQHFPSLVDTKFTARMEGQLDEIAEGSAAWLPYLEQFFLGPEGLESQVSRGQTGIDPREASTVRLEGLSASVRIGKFGPFVEKKDGEQTLTASLPEGVAPADLSPEDVDRLVQSKAGGGTQLGIDPATGQSVLLMVGRFGPYVQLGEVTDDDPKPRRSSLPKGVEASSLTLDEALKLLALPRTLGRHPESGEEILAGIGRYGPYVVHQKDFRSLGPSDDVHGIDLPRALQLFAEPKKGSGGAQVLREVGAHPADGEPIRIYEGRFGPYVKHGGINASLPKGADPDELTITEAVELLDARKASGKKPRRGAGKGRGSSTATKKTAAPRKKEAAAKKTATASKSKATAAPKPKTATAAKRATAGTGRKKAE